MLLFANLFCVCMMLPVLEPPSTLSGWASNKDLWKSTGKPRRPSSAQTRVISSSTSCTVWKKSLCRGRTRLDALLLILQTLASSRTFSTVAASSHMVLWPRRYLLARPSCSRSTENQDTSLTCRSCFLSRRHFLVLRVVPSRGKLVDAD